MLSASELPNFPVAEIVRPGKPTPGSVASVTVSTPNCFHPPAKVMAVTFADMLNAELKVNTSLTKFPAKARLFVPTVAPK